MIIFWNSTSTLSYRLNIPDSGIVIPPSSTCVGKRNTRAVIDRGTGATPTAISLDNASLALQAVSVLVSGIEMSGAGRTGDTLGGRIRANGTVEFYRNGTLIGSTIATAWPYLNTTGYSGI